MNIYIRKKPKWVNFLTSQELTQVIENYTGTPICIGDIALYNKQSIQKLLKFVEDNPQVDLYSSEDIESKTLLSRAVAVYKEVRVLTESLDLKEYAQSGGNYTDMVMSLAGLPNRQKLLIKGMSSRVVNLVVAKVNSEQW